MNSLGRLADLQTALQHLGTSFNTSVGFRGSCHAMAAPPEREEVGRGSCSHTGSHVVFGILILPSENMEKAVLKYELWSLRALHTHKFSVLASQRRWEVSAYKNSTWCAPMSLGLQSHP